MNLTDDFDHPFDKEEINELEQMWNKRVVETPLSDDQVATIRTIENKKIKNKMNFAIKGKNLIEKQDFDKIEEIKHSNTILEEIVPANWKEDYKRHLEENKKKQRQTKCKHLL